MKLLIFVLLLFVLSFELPVPPKLPQSYIANTTVYASFGDKEFVLSTSTVFRNADLKSVREDSVFYNQKNISMISLFNKVIFLNDNL